MYGAQHGTVFSHIFSFLASFYVVIFVPKNGSTIDTLLLWSQILVMVNSLIAVFRYALPEGYKLRRFHVISLNLTMIGSFGLLQAHFYGTINEKSRVYIITSLNIIPFIHNITTLDYRSTLRRGDAIVAMNGLFFLWAALGKENYFAACNALSYTFGYFFVGDCGYFFDTEVPSIVIYQYMQCFQSFFALYTADIPQ